ncbi:hypothetical protein SARC_02472 [Sphaeroforma arctica JP610]|uniref:Peptidase A1 domain-containing protein n=1 Tax=Sphaeroforma arctica JP610 TaxID=667725 RepID=A0A0L0G8L4_9EUKA|nr:hypothetical protein SARC_02472 [Sphaeroforma arctica JP610]KNC85350.1 hypothetical protein SARC_02472 [Sphaeroforma arctica JP610]|eukprot:XP_014159252.1 hypothetical protein SARC_02472 [Sphaeroforma arctica JP610]
MKIFEIPALVTAVGALLLTISCDAQMIEMPMVRVPNIVNRNRRQTTQPMFENPMGGGVSEFLAYAANFTIGGASFYFLVDSGSADLLVTAVGCTNHRTGDCTGPDFEPISPSLGQCTATSYYENTGTATSHLGEVDCYGTADSATYLQYDVYTDAVVFSNATAVTQALGSITASTPDFFIAPQVAGIIGMAYPGQSTIYGLNKDYTPYLNTLTNEKVISTAAFAMCFNGQVDGGPAGGLLVLGGGIISGLTYVDVVNQWWYAVALSSMTVAGTDVGLPSEGFTIVDSGTSGLVLTDTMYTAFNTALCTFAEENGINGLCVDNSVESTVQLTTDELASLPPVLVSLADNYVYSINSSSYLKSQGGNSYLYLIQQSGVENGQKDSASVILGDVYLQGQWVYFDQQNNRLGLAAVSNCNQNYTSSALSIHTPSKPVVALSATLVAIITWLF